MALNLFKRWRVLQHVDLEGDESYLFFARHVQFHLHPSARIIIKSGSLRIGHSFPSHNLRPSYNATTITLQQNATLCVHDDVFICPGACIHIGPNADVVFYGRNWIANNLTLLCTEHMEFGRNTSVSWNVTLIDDDKRTLCTPDNEPLAQQPRPLKLSNNVGIQMNVTIPRGVAVGCNSVIGANTVLRSDVPANCLVYQNPELRVRHGTTTGLQAIQT